MRGCRGRARTPARRSTGSTRKGVTILFKNILFTVLLAALALGLLACEIPPADRAETGAAPTAAPTVELATVRVTGAVVNLRAGPSVQYEILGQVQAEDSLPVTGINADRTWLQVAPEGEIRWIFADLTDVSAELRGTLAEVVAPGLEPAVSSDTGQSESPAPAATPTATNGGLQRVEFWAPGTYADAPGLDYDFEIAWVDRSVEWDWTLKNQGRLLRRPARVHGAPAGAARHPQVRDRPDGCGG